MLHAAQRRLDDLEAASEVVREHDRVVPRVTIAEADDVLAVGPTPSVDQLVLVSNHSQVPARPG